MAKFVANELTVGKHITRIHKYMIHNDDNDSNDDIICNSINNNNNNNDNNNNNNIKWSWW